MKTHLMTVMVASTFLLNACVWDEHTHEEVKSSTKAEHHHGDHFHGKVNYACDHDKQLTVTYHFDDKGMPSEAEAMIDGKSVNMPVNEKRSDQTGFSFGNVGYYVMGTNRFTKDTYLNSQVILTAPNNQILFKNCEAK